MKNLKEIIISIGVIVIVIGVLFFPCFTAKTETHHIYVKEETTEILNEYYIYSNFTCGLFVYLVSLTGEHDIIVHHVYITTQNYSVIL